MSQIQQIKDATNIVDVIGERIELKRSGANLRGLCPFHSEKSPSFFVHEGFQRFRCFGCGESGDVFTFLEKYEGMSFYEVLQQLAQAAGIELEVQVKSHDDDRRESQLAALTLAKEYYQYILNTHAVGEPGRAYIKERGINAESKKVFSLGYAPDAWDGLLNFLHGKKGFSLQVLSESGLIVKGKHGKFYDRFRGRLIFPLLDHRGRVVGFSGRVLNKEEKTAKYINSPETPLYHKSQMLYGYHELKQSIRKAKEVIVTEGELDVISSVQAHVSNVVAIKGSALTPEHARLLRRVVSVVILALDTDSAGIEATKKAIPILKKAGLDLRVVAISEGKDPDDLARSDPKLWRETAAASQSVYDFLIEQTLRQHDGTTPEGKRAVMREIGPVLAQIEHAVELEHYAKILSQKLETRLEALEHDLKMYREAPQVSKKRPSNSRATQEQDPRQEEKSTKPDLLEKLQERLTVLLLNSTVALARLEAEKVQLELLTYRPLQQLLELLLSNKTQGAKVGHLHVHELVKHMASDIQSTLFEVFTDEKNQLRSGTDIAAEWVDVYGTFKKRSMSERKTSIAHKIEQLESLPNLTREQEVEIESLMHALVELNG